jgi:hypothetical protein
MYTSVFGKAPVSHESEVNEEPETYKIPAAEELLTNENISLFGKESNKNIPKYRFIGVAFNSYIIDSESVNLNVFGSNTYPKVFVYLNGIGYSTSSYPFNKTSVFIIISLLLGVILNKNVFAIFLKIQLYINIYMRIYKVCPFNFKYFY